MLTPIPQRARGSSQEPQRRGSPYRPLRRLSLLWCVHAFEPANANISMMMKASIAGLLIRKRPTAVGATKRAAGVGLVGRIAQARAAGQSLGASGFAQGKR